MQHLNDWHVRHGRHGRGLSVAARSCFGPARFVSTPRLGADQLRPSHGSDAQSLIKAVSGEFDLATVRVACAHFFAR